MKKPQLPTFPETVKNGNSTVKIYHQRKGEYDQYKVAYYFQNKRKMETFADYKKAKRRAGEITDSVNRGDVETLSLTAQERVEFTRAVEILKGSLREAAEYYQRKHPSNLKKNRFSKSLRITCKRRRIGISPFRTGNRPKDS
jgi:hypothetical protein